jgi:glycosyltransferase involved in cell wall biosynthesis
VALVESQLGRFGAENRTADWEPTSERGVRYIPLRTILLHVGRAALHLLMPTPGLRPVREYRVVLLGGWESPTYWWFLLAALACRVPVVGFYESTRATRRHVRGPVSVVQRWIFRRMRLVVVSGEAAAGAVRDLGLKEPRIRVGFNAVDVRQFARRAREARKPMGPEGSRFLYVGQLIRRKRVDALIRAMASRPRDTLTIVGSGAERDRLSTLSVALGVTSRVTFVDPVANRDLPSVMAAHHTLCLVSAEEVWGLVVNEALAAGLSVIVSESCGVTSSVRGMNGVHVVSDDLTTLLTAMDAAARSWNGPIVSPEILAFTPDRFASVFADAFREVSAWTPAPASDASRRDSLP